MRNIVDETGEIIAKAADDHTLIGGHHRLAVAAGLGKRLFWRDTGDLTPGVDVRHSDGFGFIPEPRIRMRRLPGRFPETTFPRRPRSQRPSCDRGRQPAC